MPDQQYIDGRWQPAADGATIPVINPTTEEVIAHVAAGGAAEVDRAVAAAKRASWSWRRTTGTERAPFLRAIAGRVRERREELVRLSSLNNGKPLGACRRIRHGAAEAEVWPGSWSADHITIADPAT